MMLRRLIHNIYIKVDAWRLRHVGDDAFLFVAAAVIGILSGMGAAILKGGIDFVRNFLFNTFDISAGNWEFFLLPVAGIFLTMLFVKYVVHFPLDHATERITDDLAKGQCRLSPRVIWGSIIGCSLTLGMGGSAGAESPVAYTGAGIGSNIGKAFRLSDDRIAMLTGIGAGAGIAGIYMAPIGGVMYALECLRMRQSLKSILVLTCCALASSLTCYLLLGCHTDVSFVPEMRFDPHLIPYVLVCGLVCGLYSVYYRFMMRICKKWFGRFRNIWVTAAVGSVTLAVLLFLFPSLYGEGYGVIGKLMDNDATSIIAYGPFYDLGKHFYPLMLMFLALLAVKPIGTYTTNDCGGVVGDFTPTLFCGAVLGFAFSTLLNHIFSLHLPYMLFAFFGMAAVMSGAKKAPLMAIFIAAEMTGLYGFILPLTLCSVVSFVTTLLVKENPKGSDNDDSASSDIPVSPVTTISSADPASSDTSASSAAPVASK